MSCICIDRSWSNFFNDFGACHVHTKAGWLYAEAFYSSTSSIGVGKIVQHATQVYITACLFFQFGFDSVSDVVKKLLFENDHFNGTRKWLFSLVPLSIHISGLICATKSHVFFHW
jgi:hypothetical protein